MRPVPAGCGTRVRRTNGRVTTAVHALVMAEDAEATRAFFRDVVRLPYADTGGGWLSFESGPSEIGVHPTNGAEAQFDVSLVCDDLDATVSRSLCTRRRVRARPAGGLAAHHDDGARQRARQRPDDALAADLRPARDVAVNL